MTFGKLLPGYKFILVSEAHVSISSGVRTSNLVTLYQKLNPRKGVTVIAQQKGAKEFMPTSAVSVNGGDLCTVEDNELVIPVL